MTTVVNAPLNPNKQTNDLSFYDLSYQSRIPEPRKCTSLDLPSSIFLVPANLTWCMYTVPNHTIWASRPKTFTRQTIHLTRDTTHLTSSWKQSHKPWDNRVMDPIVLQKPFNRPSTPVIVASISISYNVFILFQWVLGQYVYFKCSVTDLNVVVLIYFHFIRS